MYQEYNRLLLNHNVYAYPKEGYILKLLRKRLKILDKFIHVAKHPNRYAYYKNCLVENQIFIMTNAKYSTLKLINFKETENNILNHIMCIKAVCEHLSQSK